VSPSLDVVTKDLYDDHPTISRPTAHVCIIGKSIKELIGKLRCGNWLRICFDLLDRPDNARIGASA